MAASRRSAAPLLAFTPSRVTTNSPGPFRENSSPLTTNITAAAASFPSTSFVPGSSSERNGGLPAPFMTTSPFTSERKATGSAGQAADDRKRASPKASVRASFDMVASLR